ncbi:polyprenol monophosphomannose synthase [Chlorobium phaeovibrioides]|uniref:Polyprenol monophosphomannose synthase n=1 Tax=Chlorobium phaeovibrioides TaxID=1094 RepID=A0A5M8ICQ9_CHLPH|nr:polyprenol monophosphomannose synthase [Chlorobium phaeovibrioides]KAA6233171.1 polyprenol monophosphomannose synthase [Chlorobium phaeovibrioides]QEQ56414.1 polyprenol monophosphomannose synthase [Chlorobium phaeovibrioides]
MNQSLVIIPTYCEARNIGRMLDALAALYPDELDVLVIDDSSPDGTADVVRQRQQGNASIALIERSGKMGLGTAYLAGFRYALERDYRFILEMDADFSHDPAMISALLQEAESADLVIGSRYVNNTVNVVNWPLGRLVLSRMASIYTQLVTGLPVADPTGGFKCFRRETLEAIDLRRVSSQGYSFQIEMNFRAWKQGLILREIPIVFVDRTVGESKMTRQNIREAVWIVWWLKLRSLLGAL